MNLKLNRISIGKVFLFTYLFELCFLRWTLMGQGIIKIIIFVLCLALIYAYQGMRIRINRIFILLSLIAMYSIFNIILSDEYTNLFSNVHQIILSMVVAYCFSLMSHDLDEYISVKLILVLNIYFVVNTLIILIQNINHDFLVRTTVKVQYFDNLTGFIGETGTHRLTYFWLFIIFLNILALKSKVNKYKKLFELYIISSVLVMFYLSVLNDNRAFYFVFAFFFLGYMLFLQRKKDKIFSLVRICVIGLIMLLCFTIAYSISTNIQYMINVILKFKVSQYIKFILNGEIAGISEERLLLIYWTLVEANGLKFGNGIGSNMIDRGGVFLLSRGIRNDLCFFIYMGGIVYWFMITYYYYYTYKMMNLEHYIKNNIANIFFFSCLFISTVYTNPYTEFLISGTLSLIMCVWVQIAKNMHSNYQYKETAVN